MTREIPLTRGYVALVDDEDYDLVTAAGKWWARPDHRAVYACRTTTGVGGHHKTTQQMHTLITGWPMVDHINGDGLDNRRANLRRATRAQNAANQRVSRVNNTSGYKGVSREGHRWRATIGVGGKSKWLGYHDTAEQAARAYDAAAIEVYGEFACINFPIDERVSA